MYKGEVENGLEVVRLCRDRYDERIRNPFNEYECGNWYARAMLSYALMEGLTVVLYDAVDRTLFIDSRIGDFTSFLSTDAGISSYFTGSLYSIKNNGFHGIGMSGRERSTFVST